MDDGKNEMDMVIRLFEHYCKKRRDILISSITYRIWNDQREQETINFDDYFMAILSRISYS